jgi:hypothetical protein
MAKHYSKEISDKQLENITDSSINYYEPSKKSIDFILNYSKSISVEKSENIGTFFFNLN